MTNEEMLRSLKNANTVSRKLQEVQTVLESDIKPPEVARPDPPYVETAQFEEKLNQMQATLQDINHKLETEKCARLESEKTNTRFQWANLILVALTLIATIVFGLGIHSCTGTAINDTNGTQESEFATTDSVSAAQS